MWGITVIHVCMLVIDAWLQSNSYGRQYLELIHKDSFRDKIWSDGCL